MLAACTNFKEADKNSVSLYLAGKWENDFKTNCTGQKVTCFVSRKTQKNKMITD